VVANVFERLRSLVLSVLLIVCLSLPAFAGAFEDAVAKFANDEFSDTEEAIGTVASSGNPLAFAIISALQDGRLSADPDTKKVFITQDDGKVIDAAGKCRRCPPQQPPASYRRGRARRPDTVVARSGKADRGRAVGIQDS
jgi:hypothetical protein